MNSPSRAPEQIDYAIRSALREKKPAYIEIACNIAAAPCAAPGPIVAVIRAEPSDQQSLHAAVNAAVEFIGKKQKPVLLIGSKLRAAGAEEEVVALADALWCSVAVMAAAKSFLPETHPQFVGVYWGEVSSPGVREIVDWCDGVICLGTIFNNYSSVGWTAVPNVQNVLEADFDRVQLPGHNSSRIHFRDFLVALARKVAKRDATMVEYKRIRSEDRPETPAKPEAKLTRAEIFRQVRPMVTSDTTILAETGDSWFNGIALKLPTDARFETEMQWGHIGWSVPAAFGYAMAAPRRRVITLVGDGSFQLTAQEVAQMIRNRLPVMLFLINNNGYTVEVEIHDGPYNNIKNWDYAALMQAFNAEDGQGRGFVASTRGQLATAIKESLSHRDGPTLIECRIDRDDCSPELISWGHVVATSNARPPRMADAVGPSSLIVSGDRVLLILTRTIVCACKVSAAITF